MNLFVGLDVSSEKLDVCFLSDDDNLTILEEITLGNDIDGATTVKEKVITFKKPMASIKSLWVWNQLPCTVSTQLCFLIKIKS